MATTEPTRKPHDMGGDPAGPVDTHEHTPTLVERRIDAMMQLLRQKPRAFWVTDENRRTIESLTPETYRDSSYYQKWCLAMRSLLVEKGVLTDAEIQTKFEEVKARHSVQVEGPSKRQSKPKAKSSMKSKSAPRKKKGTSP
jgi:hypothetical protein